MLENREERVGSKPIVKAKKTEQAVSFLNPKTRYAVGEEQSQFCF